MDDSNSIIPEVVLEEAIEAYLALLPEKSREKYEMDYSAFRQWLVQRRVKEIKKNIILAYKANRSNDLRASSLWSKYSMPLYAGYQRKHLKTAKCLLQTQKSKYLHLAGLI